MAGKDKEVSELEASMCAENHSARLDNIAFFHGVARKPGESNEDLMKRLDHAGEKL